MDFFVNNVMNLAKLVKRTKINVLLVKLVNLF